MTLTSFHAPVGHRPCLADGYLLTMCSHDREREREEREERERKDSLVSFVGVISILFTYLFLKIFWDVDCF